MFKGVELHDSCIRAITVDGADVTVRFGPAYVHISAGKPGVDLGSGWVQDLDLSFTDATLTSEIGDFPRDLDDGEVSLGGVTHKNLVPLPLDFHGDVSFVAYSIRGERLSIHGTAAKIVLHGEPTYVEQFPGMGRQ